MLFEETNQTMEEREMEALPENPFDDEGENGDSSTALRMTTEEEQGAGEGENGSDSNNAQNSEENGKNGENHAKENTAGNSSTLRVKYNGEERNLSLDEARTLAQKGLNYDHVVAERDKNRMAFDFLLERAKSEGITVEQLIEKERGKAENQRLEAKMSEIRARDDDASEDTVKSLARFELEAEKVREERERAQALEEKNNAEIEGWNRLFREHPELLASEGGSKVSQGVFDLVKKGHSPIEAYYIERNRELEAQNKMYSSANEAKKKSVGSLSGSQGMEDEDDFLAGFNSNRE